MVVVRSSRHQAVVITARWPRPQDRLQPRSALSQLTHAGAQRAVPFHGGTSSSTGAWHPQGLPREPPTRLAQYPDVPRGPPPPPAASTAIMPHQQHLPPETWPHGMPPMLPHLPSRASVQPPVVDPAPQQWSGGDERWGTGHVPALSSAAAATPDLHAFAFHGAAAGSHQHAPGTSSAAAPGLAPGVWPLAAATCSHTAATAPADSVDAHLHASGVHPAELAHGACRTTRDDQGAREASSSGYLAWAPHTLGASCSGQQQQQQQQQQGLGPQTLGASGSGQQQQGWVPPTLGASVSGQQQQLGWVSQAPSGAPGSGQQQGWAPQAPQGAYSNGQQHQDWTRLAPQGSLGNVLPACAPQAPQVAAGRGHPIPAGPALLHPQPPPALGLPPLDMQPRPLPLPTHPWSFRPRCPRKR